MYRTDQKGNAPVHARPGTYLRLSTLRVVGLAALLILPWVIVFSRPATAWRHGPGAAATTSTTAASPATTTAAQPLPAGPWGELEYTPITIEPPADAVHRFESADTSRWYIRDCTTGELAARLKDAGVGEVQRNALVAAASPDRVGNGVLIRPDAETLAALAPDVRSALYGMLAADPRNAQSEPFRHPVAGPDWFAQSGLAADTVALVRKYVYRRGDFESFADISAVLPSIAEPDERARLFRTLASQTALIVRLRVRPDSDLPALVTYWGRGHLERDVAPLLESLAKVPGGGTVDVDQLLPAFPRARLNTYPPPVNVDGSVQGIFDCHWTSLNFWNTVPDTTLTDGAIAARQFDTAYHKIEKPTQLGDVIMLCPPDGTGIHSAVFIGGDVIFTKNGASITAPWILARLPDVVSYYETVGPLKMLTFRRNDL
jgi:hypothetical protein